MNQQNHLLLATREDTRKLKVRHLVMAMGFALGGGLAILPGVTFAQQIVVDGRTQTTLAIQGNVTDVRTSTLVGNNAFNSFSKFDVYKNNVVNLHVPTGAANLLNLINSSDPSRIDGMLNSIRNGGIGGNVYLANPAGLIVGQSGSINVGSLTVVTPTRSFVEGFFDGTGSPSAAATSALLNGAVPINPSGLISVQGKINAAGNVTLAGGSVVNSGAIHSGASFAGSDPDFSDIVNVNGFRSGAKVVVESGLIEILAAEDISNTGLIESDGAKNVRAGKISLQAGRDILLAGTGEISAAGQGENSAGGDVLVMAQRDTTLADQAKINTSAGASGDAGNIELSAKNTVVLAGGALQADAANGKAGNILIDPFNLDVQKDLLRGIAANEDGIQWSGSSLTLQADNKITIGAGRVVSTRQVDTSDPAISARDAHISGASTGNSGNLTLTAREIALQAGSQLLAQADGIYTGGKVTLDAHDASQIPTLGWANATARVDINGATIKANEVVITAKANVDSQFVYADENPLDVALNVVTASAQQLAGFALTLGGVNLVVSDVDAKSYVNINTGSTIEAAGNVTLGAENVTKAGMAKRLPSPGAQFNTPLGIGALYVRDASDAQVTVNSGATIKANNLDVHAQNLSSMEGSIASAQNQTENSGFIAIAAAITSSDIKSTALVNQGANIKVAGNVTVAATNSGSYETEVTSATGPNGRAAAAIAISDNRSTTTATLAADVKDATNVQVLALNDIKKDITTATAKAGGSEIDRIIASGKLKAAALSGVDGVEKAFWDKFGLTALKPDNKSSPSQQSFRIGGAIAYNTSVHSATATIGAGAIIHASDSVAVVSRVRAEDMKISAQAAALSTSSKGSQANDTSRMAYGVGLSIGSFEHNALSLVGQDADVTASRIAVHSDTLIPQRKSLLFGNTESWRWTGLETIYTALDSINNIFDVFNGVSSAKSTSDGSDGSIGLSGSVSILDYKDTSRAVIDSGAKLNQNTTSTGDWTLDYVVAPEKKNYYLGVLYSTDLERKESFKFAAPVVVQAEHVASLMFQAGEILPSSTGEKGLGAALDIVNVNSTTEAIVREGAVIQRITETGAGVAGEKVFTRTASGLAVDDVRVTAKSTENLLSLAASAGYGATFGGNGTYSQMVLNSTTRALVDDEASITARALKVDALSSPTMFSLSGGLNLSSSASVGIGIALNDVTTTTKAEIADNDTLSITDAARTSRSIVAGAKIKANDLAVTAKTDGHLEAISVAGAVANKGATDAGPFDKLKDGYQKILDAGNALASVSLNSPAKTGSADTQQAEKKPPSLSISGAGSGSINITEMTTLARIEGVTIEQAKPVGITTGNELLIRGISNSDITAASGAAAITRANRPGQKTAVGISGSLALNSTGNSAEALLKNSVITDANDVTLQALTGGEQLSVALGMAIDASNGGGAKNSYALVGSLSLTQSLTDDNDETKNRTVARVVNTSLTGQSGTSGRDLDVTAYNRSYIGTGAGSLQLTTGSTQKGASVGGAVTWANIRNDVLSGIYDSPTVTGFDTAGVRAYNATEIGSGAAMLSLTAAEGKDSFSGSMVVNQITNHTTAEIVRSKVTATGNIEVLAKDQGADAALETAIDPDGNRAHVAKGLDYCGEGAGGATPSGNCITAVAGTVQIGRSANVGASIAYNQIANNLTARIADSEVTVSGFSAANRIDVIADSDTSILGVGFGVGASGNKFSGAGSLSIGVINNIVHAKVERSAAGGAATILTAPTIKVEAQDKAIIKTVAGQVNIALKDSALGAAVTYNEIGNEARATVDTATLKSQYDIYVHAKEISEIHSLAAAGGLAKGTAGSLSLAMSFIDNTTEARISGSQTQDPDLGDSNAVRVKAEDTSKIHSLSGSVGIGQTAGAGAAFSLNRIGSSTTAKINNSTLDHAYELSLNADQALELWSISAAVGAGKAGYAGSLSINDIGQSFIGNNPNMVTAELVDSTLQNGVGGFVTVHAKDHSDLRSVAGAVAIGASSTAIGAAVADNNIQSVATARISGSSLKNSSAAITIEGINESSIKTLSAAGAGSAEGAFAGSASSNRTSNKTYGEIINSEITGAYSDVNVTATDTAGIDAFSGGAAISGDAAAGLAISVNQIDNTTTAHVSGKKAGSGGYAVRNLKVQGTSGETIKALSIGVGASGEVGVAGSFSINTLKSHTNAYIDNGAVVVAERNVGVLAESDDKITVASGAAGVGIGAGGLGASFTVNYIGSTTAAYVDGSSVTALAKEPTDVLSVNSGDLITGTDTAVDLSALNLATYNKLDLKSKKAKKNITGLAVNASSTQHIDSITANVAGGTGVGVAVIESVSAIGGSTSAYINNSNINPTNTGAGANQSVDINASNIAFANSFIGNLAIGGAAAGFGADIIGVTRTTQAYAQGGQITAQGAVNVRAKGTQAVSDIAVGGAVGGLGAAGTLSFVQLANLTEAYVDGTRINAGSLSIKALNENNMYQVGGVLAAGGDGYGGTFVVSLSDSTTRATLKNTGGADRVVTSGDVAVEADNKTNAHHIAVAVAGGGGNGIAGMVSLNVITDKTEALLDNADVGADSLTGKVGNVSVKATHLLDTNTKAGALGIGISAVGVGAGASINVIKARTTATSNNSNIYASGQTAIEAESIKHVIATAMTAGVGSTAGIGGAAVITLVGDDVQGDSAKEADKGGAGTLSEVSKMTSGDHLSSMTPQDAPTTLAASDKALIDSATQKNVRDIATGGAAGYVYRTAATTTGTGTIKSGSVNVVATDKTDTKTRVGGFGVSLGLGAGGAFGITSVKSNVAANIGSGTTLTTTGNIVVSALASNDTGKAIDILSLAGGVGSVSLGAAISDGDVINTVDASIGGGASAGTGTITVTAVDSTTLDVDAKGASIGAAAAGIVVADAKKSSTVNAALGGSTYNAGNVTVSASESGRVQAVAQSASGGLSFAANGAFADAKDTGAVSAFTGGSTTFNLGANTLSITASATPEVDAQADGISVSGGLNIGGSEANATALTTVNAYLGTSNTVNASALMVQALALRNGTQESARAAAFAAGGGLLLGLNATVSKADSVMRVYSQVGDSSTLSVTGTTNIIASTNSQQASSVDAYNGGIVAAGFNDTEARSDTETLSFLGSNVKVTGGTLNIHALATDDNFAESASGSGGLVSGAAATAKTTNRSTTIANIRNSSAGRTIQVAALDINANHLAKFNTKVSSVNASLLGASGGNAINLVDRAIVQANLGNNLEIIANSVDVNAINRTRKDVLMSGGNPVFNITAASGGLFDLPAVRGTTTVSNDTDVIIGTGTLITTRPAGVATGHLSMGARNDVQLYDMVKLDSGGALPIAKAESFIYNDKNDADITIGSGTKFDSNNTITLETKTEAIADTEVQAKTYGLAGAAQGNTVSRVKTANNVTLNGARLESDESVEIYAGYNNNLRADAETRLWNNTAIPMKTSPDARGEIEQNNAITIAAYVPKTGTVPSGATAPEQIERAAIATVKDIHLKAGEGTHVTRGYGRGTDLYRQFIADAVAIFGADISLDITGGSVRDSSVSDIVNNGTLFAGTHYQQFLYIDAAGVITKQSEGMATPVLSANVDLARDISDRIARLQALYDEYKTDNPDIANGFLADIQILNAKKNKLGVGATADFLNIQPAAAYTGYIFANGGSLTGGGELIAPGDAKIEVRNASNKFMRIVGNGLLPSLFISEDLGGVVTMNGVRVSSNDDINNINRSGKSAGFTKVLDRQTSADPVILLENTYSDPVNLNALNPEIHVDGDITNKRGLIKIESVGSVQVSSNLVAKTIDIATQGDFIKTFTTGFTHQGGDPTLNVPNNKPGQPATVWRDVKDPLTGVVSNRLVPYTLDLYYEDLASGLYPNHTPSSPSGVPSSSVTTHSWTDTVSPPVTEGSVIAGNNVFISGEKLNINGLIQSGLPSYQVNISQTDANNAISAGGGWIRLAMTENGESVKDVFRPQLRWDAANARLELGSVAVAGGYIQLYGDIFSTGNGKLKVLDGYGRINVTNTSSSALAVNKLDTGPGVAGMIKITDTSTKNADGKPLETTITRVGDNFTYSYVNFNSADDRTPTVTDTGGAEGRNGYYNPRDGRRLFWMDAETWVDQYWESYTKSCYLGCSWFGGDILSGDPGTRTGYNSTAIKTVRPNGQWLSDVSYTKGVAQPDYQMDYTKTISATPMYGAQTGHWWTDTCVAGICVDDQEYFQTTRYWNWVERAYYVHSLNASKPIAIEFSGYNTGDLTVNNAGKKLELQGAVRNLTGTTTLTASDIHAAETTLVQANNLNLTASAGSIGAAGVDPRLQVILQSGGKLDATASGDLAVRAMQGQLEIFRANAGGLVSIGADGDLVNVATGVAVAGGSIVLGSDNGKIGSSAKTMLVDVTSSTGTLNAAAAKDIHITENAGDMRLDQVSSIAGDITLVASNGSIVDANTEARVDIESRTELLAVAARAGLQGAAAAASEMNTVNGYNQSKQQLYSRYWQMRNVISDGAGGYTADAYDAQYAYHLSAADVTQLQTVNGWTAQQVSLQEARQTAIYHSAHAEFGAQAFDANYRYNVKTADNATYQKLIAGSTWSDDQITNRIAAGIFKDTADTEALIEKANISGRNITLTAANGGIGVEKTARVIGTNPGAWSDDDRLALVVADRNDVVIDAANHQITIRQKDDVDITMRAPGELVATAAQEIYIGSEDDIRVRQVSSPNKDIRIKTGASLINVAGAGVAPVDGRNVILEAGAGDVGSAGSEFLVGLSGALTARARGDLFVRNQAGDMLIEQVFAGNLAKLTSMGAMLESNANLVTDVQANKIWLTAATTIGQGDSTKLNFLDIGSDPDGWVDLTGPNGIYVYSPSRNLNLRNISANNGELAVSSFASTINIIGDVRAKNNVAMDAAESINFSDSGRLSSTAGDIALKADGYQLEEVPVDYFPPAPQKTFSVKMDGASEINALAGKIGITAAHDVKIGTLTALSTVDLLSAGVVELNRIRTLGDVTITADGAILNRNLTNDVNITGGKMLLTSSNATVGEAGNRIVTEATGTFKLGASTGIHLEQRQGDLVGETSTVTGPTDLYVPNGLLHLTKLKGDTVDLTAGTLTIDELIANVVSLTALFPDGQVSVADAKIARSMVVSADNINLPNISYTGTGGALHLSLSGPSGGMASQTYAFVSTKSPVVVDNLSSAFATVHSNGPLLDFLNVRIGKTAQLSNSFSSVLVNNLSQVVSGIPDAQLYAPDSPFSLSFFNDRQFALAGAYVVNYSPDFIVNAFSTENSVSRLIEKLQAINDQNPGSSLLPGGVSFGGVLLARRGQRNGEVLVFSDKSSLFDRPPTKPSDIEVVE